MHRVFVYGTLKRGQQNHYLMTDKGNGVANYIGKAKTIDRYPLIIGGRFNNPFMLDSKGQGKIVQGELYEVDDKMLATLDILEEIPLLYQKDTIQIQKLDEQENGPPETLPCLVYYLRNFRPELLEKTMFEVYDIEVLDEKDRYVLPADRPVGVNYHPDVLLPTQTEDGQTI